jgi:hypothetical protein
MSGRDGEGGGRGCGRVAGAFAIAALVVGLIKNAMARACKVKGATDARVCGGA